MALYIGIDSGTQSTKAVVLDLEAARVVAQARAPLSLIAGLPPGHQEQHPQDWIAALDRVLLEVASQIDRSRVRGIGVSGQQHGFVPLDAQGEVIRPAKLWCDTSTVQECALLTERLGGERAAIRKLGNPILPGYTAPKILWMKRRESAHYRRLRHVLLPHDYLNYYLSGEYRMEFGDASGTALLDVRQRRWSPAALAAIGPEIGDFLPPLGDSADPVGPLRSALADKYGFPREVVISAGGGDNMMGAIGTGNVKPGVITASFGTSGTIYAYANQPVVDPEGEIAGFCSSTGGWLPLLCTMNVTTVTERFRALGQQDHAAFDAAVAEAPVGAGGLLLLPYFAGERTPNLPQASGVLLGLSADTLRPGHLARASMEGVTLGMNYGLRRLAALGVKGREIRATGGGARSPVWRQIMADVFGLPVVGMATEEGAALGAALQAAWCVARQQGQPRAKITDFTQGVIALDESTRCRPDKSRHRQYGQWQSLHDQLSAAVREIFVAHRELTDA